VQPYALMTGAPEARDLMQCGFEFAGAAVEQDYAAFETLLVSILRAFPGPRPADAPDLAQIAHVLTVSARGFKGAARSVEELRGMLSELLRMTAASLQQIS
jgi:hypothetical protein